MKTILSSLFALCAVATTAWAAGGKATFTLKTSSYYLGDRVVMESPSFVDGQRGSFDVFEDEKVFPTSTSFSINGNIPEGYSVSKWVLSTHFAGGGKTVETWGATDSVTVTFDYDWVKRYGTYLELTVYLEPMKCTISYSSGKGEWTAGEPEGGTYAYGDVITAPGAATVECENHTLKGWQASGGSLIAPGANFTIADLGTTKKSATLTAQWSPAEYKVTLNANGGTVAEPLTSYEYGVGATLPLATKEGCDFLGWWDNPTFSGTNTTKILKTDSGDKEFWAKYASAIHYDGNGATGGTMADSRYEVGVKTKLTANAYTRAFTVTYDANGGTVSETSAKAAYDFRCWNSEPNGNGAYTYTDAQEVTNPCGAKGDGVTLYAQWQPKSVTVTLPTPTKEGDTFLGWFTEKSGGIRVGGAGDAYAPAHDIKLYAQWQSAPKAKSYTVKFSPGAHEVTNPGAVADRTALEGASVILPDCDYNNLGSMGFKDWEYNGKTYNPGAALTYGPVNDGDIVLVRAGWKDCGTLSNALGLDNAIMKFVDGPAWTTNLVEGGIQVTVNQKVNPFIMSTKVQGPGKLTFAVRAQNAGEEEPVYAEGALCTVSNGAHSVAYKDIPLAWQHLTFEVMASGVQTVEWTFERTVDMADFFVKDVTWTPTDSSCTISTPCSPSAGGSVTGGGKYDVGDTVTLTATPNSEYKFVRWSDGSTENPHVIEATCDETYQAIFEGGETPTSFNYYILFDGNGADNPEAMTGQAMVCGGTGTLETNKFVRSGFTFKGWAKVRYGEIAYDDKDTITDIPASAPNATKTLYAVWEKSVMPTALVTITGATVEKKYTGKTITVETSYTFTSSEPGYTSKDFKFIGVGTVSGTAVGTYPMGLSEDDFVNLSEEYDVTFSVTDGALVITKDEPGPGPEPGGDYTSTVGVAVVVDLGSDYPGLKSVSGLPSGLRYYAKTGIVSGTPTRAYDEKTVTLRFTDGTKDTITWTVEALPELMIGTYNGAAKVMDGSAGQFVLKLTKAGKVSGSFYVSGKKITFKATTLLEAGDDGFGAAITYKYNRVAYEDHVLLQYTGACGLVPLWEASLGETSDVLDDILGARRDVIKETYGKLKTGSYAIDDPALDVGEYLNAKVSTKGVVKVSGKLYSEGGKLTSVSSSSQLTVDEDGALSCWITIYKKVGRETPIQYIYQWTLPEED